MIKGTRMIVITKKKIISVIFMIFLIVFSICIIKATVKKSEKITAFSAYEEILTKEIMPAKHNEDKEDGAKKLLKHFFAFGEEKIPEEVPEEPETPLITSEAKKADRGLKVSNATSFNVSPEDFLKWKPAVLTENPEILIMHTHTTESYSEERYAPGAPDRNVDESKNIVAVGAEMARVFESHGIKVHHDRTVHDYPAYNGAYQRAAQTISENLEKNRGINIVLDVHRDGITKADGTKVKLVAEINGEDTAQVMLVAGSNQNLQHDNWQENFCFAAHIQAKAIELFPSLMRPIDLRQERFNQQLTKGSLIVEVGTNGNTMEEALRGGRDVAEAISQVLYEN